MKTIKNLLLGAGTLTACSGAMAADGNLGFAVTMILIGAAMIGTVALIEWEEYRRYISGR